MLPELARHIVVQKNRWEDEEEATRAASCASASLQRVKDPVGNTDRSGRTQCQSKKDGKYQADNRVGKTGARGGKCGEVGLVSRPHLLFGGIRSVTTVLKVVEEEQEGLQEIEGE